MLLLLIKGRVWWSMKKSELIKNLKEVSKDYSVLYVEDNEKLRLQATTFLAKFFDKLHVSEDGQAGLETFKEHKPDLIITDIKMPKMDGIKMIHEIRKLSKDVIIIISSGHDDKDYLFFSYK